LWILLLCFYLSASSWMFNKMLCLQLKVVKIQLQHFSLYNQLPFTHCVYIPHIHCLNVNIHHNMVLCFWAPFLSWNVCRFACIHGDVAVLLQVLAKKPFAHKILFTLPKLASKLTCITHQLMFPLLWQIMDVHICHHLQLFFWGFFKRFNFQTYNWL
jgi:hypothetical protein